MTAGPFIMTNLEGLFSPFRHLDSEMDELRTMRRVSQIWQEMERREQGAWTMFGRFFDRHMDEVNRITSASWGTGMFNHPRIGRFNSSFGRHGNSSNQEESNVIVEFPDDKEIKITLEEPSVVITEVEDSTEPSPEDYESPIMDPPRESSPTRKTSIASQESDSKLDIESESKSSFHVASVNNDSVEHSIHLVESNHKTEKIEKKHKKVDFSKMEVHFEPGSGKVNIVETNEKPPSNQLFRKKRRHRSLRSESPKMNYIRTSESESYESFDSTNYESPIINSNIKFTHLQNNLDLSIFNLRNALFKNSIDEFTTPNSKNVLNSSPTISDNSSYIETKMNNVSEIDKKIKTMSTMKLSFNGSTKLQDMIQNSINHQIKVVKTHTSPTKYVNSEKPEKQQTKYNYRSVHSPINSMKSWNNPVKRSNSRGKDLTLTLDSTGVQKNSIKQTSSEEKVNNRLKSVNRTDSFKKNSKVARQESLRSTSSRGSISGETRLCQKKNNLKDSFKRDSNSRIHRAPSIGRIMSNSLKKGGIYVDGGPKKTKGSTVTLISYSNNVQNQNDSEKTLYNNVGVNNQLTKNKVTRRNSLKSYCSKESLSSSPNKIAQNKIDVLRDLPQEKGYAKPVESKLSISDVGSNNSSCEYAKLKFSGRLFDYNKDSKNVVYRNIPIRKQESFNSDSSNNRLGNTSKIPSSRKTASDLINKKIIDNDVNINKDSLKIGKNFNHQDSSLFKPIKKEKSVHSTIDQFSDIKTPVAIRKKLNYSESKRISPSKENISPEEKPKRTNLDKNDVDKSGYMKFAKSPSKLSLTSLRRSKEPLRSFEKISNGWVGRCNMTSSEASAKFIGRTSRTSDTKITGQLNNLGERNQGSIRDSMSPVSQSSYTSKITQHQQREAMIRLSKGYPSRRLESPSSSYSKQNIETRKRSRNVYTPSSISSQSSNIPVTSKRRPAQYIRTESVRSDTPVPSEPIYETLNSRRKAPTSTVLAKRNRHSNPCCNI